MAGREAVASGTGEGGPSSRRAGEGGSGRAAGPTCGRRNQVRGGAESVRAMAAPAAGTGTSFDDLCDDSVADVLVRLPSQASLAVSSAACKRWRGVCTSPSFLRRFRRRHLGAPFLGLLHSKGGISDLRLLRDADDAARYAACNTVAWSQCVGEVVYSCCSSRVVGQCLVALDTRTMSRSIVTLPRYLQRIPWKKPPRNFTLMEMDDRGNIGLVAADESKFILRVWLRHEEGDDTAATGEGKDYWMLFRKVVLQGLANRVAERYGVHLNALQVIIAYSGTVHLRLVALPEEQGKHRFFFAAKEQEQGEGSFCFFASLNLASMEFSNVQSETVRKEDRFYPVTLPWRPPFLPPPGDEEGDH